MEELPNIDKVRRDMIKMWSNVVDESSETGEGALELPSNQANEVMMQMYQTECQYSKSEYLPELMQDAEDTLSQIGKEDLIPVWKETFNVFYSK